MADRHPYVPSLGGLTKALTHFKKSFPSTVNSNTLKKLGFAPNNESYVINVLRFLELIDKDGKKTNAGATIFSNHDDKAFEEAFAARLKDSYSGLFELHDEQTWNLARDALISFFRTTDQTTSIVGQRQAATFQLLTKFAGRGDASKVDTQNRSATEPMPATRPTKKGPKPVASTKKNGKNPTVGQPESLSPSVGLTVRIEVNLPASGDQDTYDRIFKSIRENLLSD